MATTDEDKHSKMEMPGSPPSLDGEIHIADNADGLQRRLNNRQIQLIAIGGSIGTALFVSIGAGLAKGGPASLLIAFTLYPLVLGLVNNSIAEMTVLYPVSGGFIRLAGHFVDDALGFMIGWNFFIYEALLIPFEITALNLVIGFWDSRVKQPGPTAGICAAVIICYAALNILAVRGYGEAEFWLSGGKVILLFILFAFTFITMVGGNPQHNAYGFTHWKHIAFQEYISTGAKGRFEGFLGALWSASFAVVGPEYISMVAAEAKRPRIYIKTAFKTIYWRFGLFFFGSALAVGIVLACDNPTLVNVQLGDGGSSDAGASPYVIAMEAMGIQVLPHIVNALMLTSIFSAGNTYTYCATRSLYGLALEGRAPAFLRKCNSRGVPIYCFFVVMCFPFLSFLQVGSGSAIVVTWFVDLITAGGIIDYIGMSITFIFYYRACQAQGVDRRNLPYYGRFQPYGAYIAIFIQFLIIFFYGYTAFSHPITPDKFFKNYTMQCLAPILFFGWKLLKRTKLKNPAEVDLVWERPTIDAYENRFTEPPVGFWTEMLALFGYKKSKVRQIEG
ncbi:Amino acid/polyamine transporter I [Cordyceps fumosorosea ARSEF 2679]|uniref:Amino acid/polyamine transporter I n=1 Tax=Cordyceps fumosorosea (strain ARSEF 2679) TaxID=1081104 RepID=A0A168BPG2_CORFA|nr:Amino acid/polyamine transporter I [Cordyceps fumosorosea ARSEF 2679]OAA70381.1 Amino acid/polyamine transporter I [Cordyceps fumosorosea ARSEF 2679]